MNIPYSIIIIINQLIFKCFCHYKQYRTEHSLTSLQVHICKNFSRLYLEKNICVIRYVYFQLD